MDSSYQGYTSMIYQRVQRVQTYLPGMVTMKEMPTFLCHVTVTCHKFSQEGESLRAITANSKDGNRQRTSILKCYMFNSVGKCSSHCQTS